MAMSGEASLQKFFPTPSGSVAAGSPMVSGCFVLDGAIELIRFAGDRLGWNIEDVRVERTGSMRRLTGQYGKIKDGWLLSHPNELSQRKVSLHSFGLDADGALVLSVDETEWAEVRPIHDALSSDGAQELRASLTPFIFDLPRSPVPNILGIHGIIETSDQMIVITQRSKNVAYHPQHWSASFEEQIEPSDLAHGRAAFHVAASRGVDEEFLFEGAVHPSSCKLLALLAESRILNLAVVAYITIPFSSSDLIKRHRDLPEGRQEFEQGKMSFIRTETDVLAKLVMAERFPYGDSSSEEERWHPTSRYRLLAGMIHRFGMDETLEALARQASGSQDLPSAR